MELNMVTYYHLTEKQANSSPCSFHQHAKDTERYAIPFDGDSPFINTALIAPCGALLVFIEIVHAFHEMSTCASAIIPIIP